MDRTLGNRQTKEMQAPSPGRRGLWLALIAAAILRFYELGAQSLWVDEIFTWQTSSPNAPLTWLDIVSNLHGPLVSVFAHFWMRAFGESEFVLRLPMALASIALVPVVAGLARRAVGPKAALPAAWLVALSPFVTWYGQEFRGYVFAMLFAALAMSALLDWRARGTRRDFVALVAWTVLTTWSNMSGVLLVPVFAGAMFLARPPGRGRFAPTLLFLGLVGFALAPWIGYHFVQRMGWLEWGRLVPGRPLEAAGEPLRGELTFSWLGIPFTFYVFSVGYTLGPSLRDLRSGGGLDVVVPFLPGIISALLTFGTLAVVGVVALANRARRFERGLILAAILVPIAVVSYFALSNFKVFNPRYVAIGAPAFFVLLAAGFAFLSPAARKLTAVSVLVLFTLSLLHHYHGARYAKDDFKRAVHALEAVVAPQDVIIAAGNFSPLEFYWGDREPTPVVYWAGYARDGRMEEKFLPLRNPAGATWLVVSRVHELDPEGRLERWVQATWGAPIVAFPGVRVYRIAAPVR